MVQVEWKYKYFLRGSRFGLRRESLTGQPKDGSQPEGDEDEPAWREVESVRHAERGITLE